MLKFWYKQFPQYPSDHPDYWRIRFIEHALLITSCYFLILTLINIFLFSGFKYALLDASGLAFSLGIYFRFRQTGQVKVTAWAATLMLTGLIMLFVISTKGHAHTLLWATLIPPFSFFLIGRTWGSFISGLSFVICALLVFQQIQNPEPVTFGNGSLFNVIEVCIAQILLFRFYEKTRFSAYQKLTLRNLEIQKMAELDKLTGLYNREKLDNVLDKLLAMSALKSNTKSTHSATNISKSSSLDSSVIHSNQTDNMTINDTEKSVTSEYPISIAIIDIDHFKRINDNHGHLIGDKVLCELANLLQGQMRNDDLLARWGGEEFVMVLPNTTLADATELSERLRLHIAQHNIQDMALTISLGIAQYGQDDSAYSLLDRADKALYQAKFRGRNCVAVA
ncbi:GGDEF domain-containing protein [Shewanella saliphila]|uniref:GGDEF domain-containing protein n=1 Tax=Shewanella saliphila TaxID=2282698 RepID=UPI00166EDDB8|nr:GGDEF domain-containing protein [Shewanella saliphila]MCL1102862.1 GGDEF domain-containing protein [Shewanella saliphila]